jgi:hypothetical protein
MRVVHVMAMQATVLVALAACAGNDPSKSDGTSGNGGAGGALAGVGGTLAGSGGSAGTNSSGMAGVGGTLAGSGGSAGSASGGIGGSAGSAGSTAGSGGSAGAAAGAGAGAPPSGDGSFFPLATGNTWTFKVTEAGVVTMKKQTIGALEPVGGTGPNKDKMAYKATTEKDDGGDETISWQAEVDGKIVRYREQSFMASTGMLELEEHWAPYKLRVDASEAHLMAGVMWTEMYSETKLPVGMAPATAMASDTWRVIAVAESVTVPAGTFTALVIEKTGGTPKRYWFARGVGKVKETGTQTEELQSYDVMD